MTNRKDVLSKHFKRKHESNKRKPETQNESDNKKIKLQDKNDDFEDFQNWLNTNHTPIELEFNLEDVEKFIEPNKRKPETQIGLDNKKIKLQDNNDAFEDFQNWLNTNHTPIELELNLEDVEEFVNNMSGKGTEILQHEGFTCTQCNSKFKQLYNLNKHIKNVHQEKKLKCQNCNYATNDAPSMKNHVKRCDVRTKKELEKTKKLKLNMNEVPTQTLDNMNEVPAQDESVTTEKSAFNNLLNEKTWFVRGFQDLLGALQEYKSRLKHSALL